MDCIFVVDEKFGEKIRQAQEEMRAWRKSMRETPPIVFRQGTFIIRFE